MKKCEFIQQAAIEFMPQTQWQTDKAIAYAERLWERLTEKGYGDEKPRQPRDIPKAYDKLSPLQKAGFDVFWIAFDLKKCSKDKAAMRWLQLGDLSKAEHDAIITAAKLTAQERKTLPEGQIPKHAEGWLSERRWLGYQATGLEQQQKQDTEKQRRLTALLGDLAHAKKMSEMTGDEWWRGEAQRLEQAVREARQANA
ncbi:MAG: hypothetical protein PHR16_11790 [Methylovulum sp.]|nr:hypothetical protein [Methylovulum sp.]